MEWCVQPYLCLLVEVSVKQVRESACDMLVVRYTGAQSAAQASHPCWFLYLHIVAPTDSHASFSTAHALHPPVHSDSVFATILWSSLSPLALFLAGWSIWPLSFNLIFISSLRRAHDIHSLVSRSDRRARRSPLFRREFFHIYFPCLMFAPFWHVRACQGGFAQSSSG